MGKHFVQVTAAVGLLLMGGSVGTAAQVQERLTSRLPDPLGDGPPPARKDGQPRSDCGGSGGLVQVRGMGAPVPVPGPLRLQPGLAGAWKVRVPTGVRYGSTSTHVYREIVPGANLDSLVIAPDGRYRWGRTAGRLAEVRPHFAQCGERYFAARDDVGDDKVLRLDADGLKVFFSTGGFAAKGER